MTDIDPTPDTDAQPESDNIKQLREAAEAGAKARAEAEAAKRELAFLKAGIDTDAGPGKLLLKTYDGDPTPEAVLAAASEFGIAPKAPEAVSDPAPTSETVVTDEDRELARQRAAVAAGGDAPTGEVDVDPHEAGIAGFLEARRKGASSQDAGAHYFEKVFQAAVAGDPRALVQPRG